jgi:long-chain fatty acid transport protein
MCFYERCSRRLLAAIAFGILVLPIGSRAGSFYVPQQSIEGIGRSFAGDPAGMDDPSTIFSNPAGMTLLDGPAVSAGINILKPTISFQNRGSVAATPGTLGFFLPYSGNDGGDPGSWTPVPNAYAAFPTAGGNLWFGLGVSAPFGLSLTYDSAWFGRYDSIENKLTTIDVAPSVAYRINKLFSVGAGLDVQYADANLSNALPNTLQPGGPTAASDGLFTVKENSYAVGFNVGLMLQPLPDTRLGLTYRSGMTYDLKGNTTIAGLSGPLAGQNGTFETSTELKLPSIISFGVVHQLTPRLTLLGDVQWFNWSRFNEIRVKFANGLPDAVVPENYRDSWTAAVGAEYRWDDRLTLRTGFQFDETPTVDGFRNTEIPDGNRYWITIGASYHLTDRAVIDAAYAHAFFEDGSVDVTRSFYAGTPAAGTVAVSGLAQTNVDSLSLNFRYTF